MSARPNAFLLTLLGTGCPVASPRRYGAANLVQCGGLTILVDVGSGATQRLVAAGSNGSKIDALLITHIHSDHLVDLYQFIVSSWHQNRDRPQLIYGPPGTQAFVEAQMAAWKDERELRIAFEERTSVEAFEIEVIEFDESGPLIGTDHGQVSAVRVDHDPIEHAFGFVFESEDKKLVLSGDTRPCPALIEAARDADVLVHEVFVHSVIPPAGTRSRQTISKVASYHTLSTDVGRVASDAGAKALVLTHIVPPDMEPRVLLSHASTAFKGPIIVGEDLMEIDVQRGWVRSGDLQFAF